LDINIDDIINEVLRRLAPRNEVGLIEGLHYADHTLHRLKDYHLIYLSPESICGATYGFPVLLPELKLSHIMSISSGIACDLLSESAILLLTQGIPIRVFRENVQVEQLKLANSVYAKRFKEAYQLICDAGLTVCDEWMTENVNKTRKALFTENDAKKYLQDGIRHVTLPKGAIVTPLASDFARTNQMSIERE